MQFALRKAAEVANRWLDFDRRLKEAQDEKAKAPRGLPSGTLEQALEKLLARYMVEGERIRYDFKMRDERFRMRTFDIDERIKRWQGRRDGCRINPLVMVDKRFRIAAPVKPKVNPKKDE